jgi:hypothetical protein
MGGAFGGRAVPRTAVGVVLLALCVGLAACGAAEADPTAVPTFPTAGEQAGPSTGPSGDGSTIPRDCGRIFAPADLEALLGLPLGTVVVRTTVGVAEPSVNRTERVSCDYTRSGTGGGRALLDVNATAYTTPDAASGQWSVNVDAESGERRDVPFGSASAVVFERPEEAVLMVAYSTTNLTVVLPDQPLPGGRSRGDVLVDLALRLLPSVAVATSSPAPASAPPGATPAAQADSGR